jgi:hypothetical protein
MNHAGSYFKYRMALYRNIKYNILKKHFPNVKITHMLTQLNFEVMSKELVTIVICSKPNSRNYANISLRYIPSTFDIRPTVHIRDSQPGACEHHSAFFDIG